MNLEFHYNISAIFATIGCVIMYRTSLHPLVPLFFCLPAFFIIRIEMEHPKSIAEFFFEGATAVFGITALIILTAQISEEKVNEPARKWYFIGPFRLFCHSGI